MLITPVVLPANSPERFDTNEVEVTGLVSKIWAHSSGAVFARFMIGNVPEEDTEDPQTNTIDARLTLQFPHGQVNGQDISLCKGDLLRVSGYLSDLTQWETLRDFLLKARQTSLVERIPELAPALNAGVKRIFTSLIPESVEVLDRRPGEFHPHSNARLEGVVARVWEYGGHLFARLAVYDRHTLTTSTPGNHGRVRRIAHYASVQFVNEQVDGRGVNLKTKDRIRVAGSLASRVYSENLRSFLLRAHKADVLANLSDGQAPDEVWTAYVQTCLVAQKLIQYTKR